MDTPCHRFLRTKCDQLCRLMLVRYLSAFVRVCLCFYCEELTAFSSHSQIDVIITFPINRHGSNIFAFLRRQSWFYRKHLHPHPYPPRQPPFKALLPSKLNRQPSQFLLRASKISRIQRSRQQKSGIGFKDCDLRVWVGWYRLPAGMQVAEGKRWRFWSARSLYQEAGGAAAMVDYDEQLDADSQCGL